MNSKFSGASKTSTTVEPSELGDLVTTCRLVRCIVLLREALALELVLFLRVRSEVRLVSQCDRTNVRSTDSRQRVEAMVPLADESCALVLDKQARDQAHRRCVDREEIAWEVAALRDDPVDRRVNAVVITWRQVDDAVVELLAARGGRRLALEKRRQVPQELIETVARALDLLEHGDARRVVDDANGRHTAIHGARHVRRVGVPHARTVLQGTREELAQVDVRLERILHLVEMAVEDSSPGLVERLAQPRGKLLVVHTAPEARRSTVGQQLERLQLALRRHRRLEARGITRKAAHGRSRVVATLLVGWMRQVVPLEEADERETEARRHLPVASKDAARRLRLGRRRGCKSSELALHLDAGRSHVALRGDRSIAQKHSTDHRASVAKDMRLPLTHKRFPSRS